MGGNVILYNFGCSSSCVDTAKTIDKVAGAATGNVKSAVNVAGKTVEKMKAVGDATSQAKKINDLEER